MPVIVAGASHALSFFEDLYAGAKYQRYDEEMIRHGNKFTGSSLMHVWCSCTAPWQDGIQQCLTPALPHSPGLPRASLSRLHAGHRPVGKVTRFSMNVPILRASATVSSLSYVMSGR